MIRADLPPSYGQRPYLDHFFGTLPLPFFLIFPINHWSLCALGKL